MYNQDKQLALIYDETNVSDTNWIKSSIEIVLKLVLILFSSYVIIYFSLGIIIDSLSVEKQVLLEDKISGLVLETQNIATDAEMVRLNRIKEEILNTDKKFPKTSKLNIFIIKDSKKNALCLPNGNIYITSSLYEKLIDDQMLTFVVAHEMAHYKNKDHLKNIRHKIAKTIISIFLSVVFANDSAVANATAEGLEMGELGFSRNYEKQADIYAGKIMLILYNDTSAGQRVLDNLRENSYPALFGLFSTHPDIDSRIRVLKNLKYKNKI